MKFLSFFIPLFLAWIICVNCDQDQGGPPPSSCPDDYDYCEHGRCEVENGKATCHCEMNWKGKNCDKDSSHDKPLKEKPDNYEEVEEEHEGGINPRKCSAMIAPFPFGKNPPGCGLGTAIALFRVTKPSYMVYIYVRVICCCWQCHSPICASCAIKTGPFCREVFPTLNQDNYYTGSSWMCAPPPPHPNRP